MIIYTIQNYRVMLIPHQWRRKKLDLLAKVALLSRWDFLCKSRLKTHHCVLFIGNHWEALRTLHPFFYVPGEFIVWSLIVFFCLSFVFLKCLNNEQLNNLKNNQMQRCSMHYTYRMSYMLPDTSERNSPCPITPSFISSCKLPRSRCCNRPCGCSSNCGST